MNEKSPIEFRVVGRDTLERETHVSKQLLPSATREVGNKMLFMFPHRWNVPEPNTEMVVGRDMVESAEQTWKQ